MNDRIFNLLFIISFVLSILLIIMLIIKFVYQRFRKNKDESGIGAFFDKYIDDSLSENEITQKIKEVANINSTYPIEDKKLAQMILNLHRKLNQEE